MRVAFFSGNFQKDYSAMECAQTAVKPATLPCAYTSKNPRHGKRRHGAKT
jgi:hypothetical protein